MKVYSDVLTSEDLRETLPTQVGFDRIQRIGRPRVRKNGWDVRLTGSSPRHRNSGQYGAATWADTPPATWDEHGAWFANLFTVDPNAVVANYRGSEDFHKATRYKYDASTS